MSCSFRIISEMVPEIHTMKKCDFLKPIFPSQIILFSVIIKFEAPTSRIFNLFLAVDFSDTSSQALFSSCHGDNFKA